MDRLAEHASRLASHAERVKPALTVVGWIGFALVTADYAGFVDIPVIIAIPLWLGIAASICRWALWEGLLKPRIDRVPTEQPAAQGQLPSRSSDEEPRSENS